MDRLRSETGADPMPDPLAQLPGDEQDELTAQEARLDEHNRPLEVAPDPEDTLVSGGAPEDPARLER